MISIHLFYTKRKALDLYPKFFIIIHCYKPNGTPIKLLDVSKAKSLGWIYKTELEDGIRLPA